jgi:S1-C subfamily serine protease
MNALDVVLVLVVVTYAVSGYRLGFLVGASSTVGLLLGGLAGVLLAPALLDRLDSSLTVSLGALLIVLLAATTGQALGGLLGAALRSAVTWRPARVLDAVGGAALSVVAVLVIAWGLGYAVSGARIPWLGTQVRGSEVLSAVDAVMPDTAEEVLTSLDGVVGSEIFPRYLQPFVPEQIEPVPAPDDRDLRDPDVLRAGNSVVKVLGEASQCDRGLEGSGFVYAPERVMTNAHVVAGVSSVTVESVGSGPLAAEVVLFDPDLDVAVLAVDGLEVRPLDFDTTATEGDRAAVLGFPENGPFSDEAARVRTEQQLRSPDIYGDGSHLRDVISIRALVRPGNSGGPVVSLDGSVYGVVFAASMSDPDTGYALTADQVADSAQQGQAAGDAQQGQAAGDAVSTGACG